MEFRITVITGAAITTTSISTALNSCGGPSTMVTRKGSAPGWPIARMAGSLIRKVATPTRTRRTGTMGITWTSRNTSTTSVKGSVADTKTDTTITISTEVTQ